MELYERLLWADQNNRIQKTEPNPIRKSNSGSELKLIKYPNKFKILVSREPKPNLIRTKIFRVSEIDLYT